MEMNNQVYYQYTDRLQQKLLAFFQKTLPGKVSYCIIPTPLLYFHLQLPAAVRTFQKHFTGEPSVIHVD